MANLVTVPAVNQKSSSVIKAESQRTPLPAAPDRLASLQQRGKQVMAWADIMVRYPDIVRQLPPGLIAVAWYYTADLKDREYKHWLGPLVTEV